MKQRPLAVLLLAIALLLSACSGSPAGAPSSPPAGTPTPSGSAASSAPITTPNPSDLFSDRDLSGSYTEASAARITLSGSSASCPSNAVQISGSTVTIRDEGTYLLSGTLTDGMIIVNADKTDKVQLVLDGVDITSSRSAAIYVCRADKVFLTLAESSVNTLANGGSFTAIDENDIDSVIFSKDDLTLNGSGTLTVTSPGGHGIVSKDELTVTGGSYTVSAASHGLSANDSICISDGSITVTAGKDGLQAEHSEDTSLGFVYIRDGSFDITAEGDGISASSALTVLGGTFHITTGGGSINASQQTSSSWGGGMGGRPGGGGPGSGFGPGGGSAPGGTSSTQEDSTSIKGLKAEGDLLICGGSFSMDCADDAVHSNANLTVTGGSFDLATGDDGFHADAALAVAGGTIRVTKSYEGLEGLSVTVSGGELSLVCTDDGLNAAGGADQSGFGGFRGGDRFSSASSDSYITISGGTLSIMASGDGIDSNGSLEITGGFTTVCGPTSGDTAVLDYETTGTISGGTFIGTGAYMMAQTFSSTQGQGEFAVSVGNQPAGTRITLADADGSLLFDFAPELSFAIVILSSPDLVSGQSYTITVGSVSGTFEAR